MKLELLPDALLAFHKSIALRPTPTALQDPRSAFRTGHSLALAHQVFDVEAIAS